MLFSPQVIQAFRDGSLPTNKQIDEALLFTEKHSPVDVKKLSPDGRKLVDDIRDIIETARLQIITKNKDELMQNFIAHTQQVSTRDPAPCGSRARLDRV